MTRDDEIRMLKQSGSPEAQVRLAELEREVLLDNAKAARERGDVNLAREIEQFCGLQPHELETTVEPPKEKAAPKSRRK